MTTGRFIAVWVTHVVFVLAVCLLPACSPNGPTVVDSGGSYVPNFTFQWDEVNASGAFIAPVHRFTLITDQAGKDTGTINDQSSETMAGSRNVLTGTFKNRDLTLTVTRGTATVSITGKFLTDDTIEMREPGRTYTVKRNTTP
jgi:hypothetical protein